MLIGIDGSDYDTVAVFRIKYCIIDDNLNLIEVEEKTEECVEQLEFINYFFGASEDEECWKKTAIEYIEMSL